MGEARRKQETRARVLIQHQFCCYCGEAATTTDHCPPRTLFHKKNAPVGFQFPACAECNSNARLDDQIMGVLLRISPRGKGEAENLEWVRNLEGLKNNQPAVFREWAPTAPSVNKKLLRDRFGCDGDTLRYAGYGTFTFGPLTVAALQRFAVRLAQVLYFKHCGETLEGIVYPFHVDLLAPNLRSGVFDELLGFVPQFALPMRSGQYLHEQFSYRFNCCSKIGALTALARFNEQMYFQIIALRSSAVVEVRRLSQLRDGPSWDDGVAIKLRRKPDPRVF